MKNKNSFIFLFFLGFSRRPPQIYKNVHFIGVRGSQKRDGESKESKFPLFFSTLSSLFSLLYLTFFLRDILSNCFLYFHLQ